MTTVRANCPRCGDVEMTIRDLSVRVCADDDRGTYQFVCPICRVAVAKEADRQLVEILVSAGARMHSWKLPAELFEPHHGPPVCHDDVLEFHLALQEPDWFDRLSAADRSARGR